MNHLFETLASLLEYPSSDLNLRVERAIRRVSCLQHLKHFGFDRDLYVGQA